MARAFDELRFGRARTLNLRESLPTVADARARAEAWLRQRQVERSDEVLVITGRGAHSEGGVSPVREAVAKLLRQLERRGVVASHQEHTAGSFVVRLAPVSALWQTPRRKHEPLTAPTPPSLRGLGPETRAVLREAAERSLDRLGVQDPDAFIEDEMLRVFSAVAAGLSDGPDREARLRSALQSALDE